MNQKTSQIIAVVLGMYLLATPAGYAEPSSEIPERRVFPLNSKVKPCQDFYEHACRPVIDSFQLREDRSYHAFAFSDSAERLLEKKKAFLANIGKEKKLSARGQGLAAVYQGCMNSNARAKEERQRVSTLQKTLAEITDRKSMLEFLGTRVDSPDFSFVAFGTYPNQEDSDWNDIFLDVQLQTLPERSYYDNAELIADYEALLKSFFEILGYKKKATGMAKSIVRMEKQFAATYPLPADFREILNKPTSLDRKKLMRDFPEFRLGRFLQRIPEKTLIRDLMPMAFARAKHVLNQEPVELLKAFYLYRELSRIMDDAYPDFQKKKFAFRHNHLGGPAKRPERAERCTRQIMRKFAKEIDFELIDRIFPGFPEKRFVGLAEKVRQAIITGIKSNQWLSKAGKAGAVKKIETADLMLVKPRTENEWNFNPVVKYDSSQPLANDKKLAQAINDKEIKELKQKRDKRRWLMGPLTVNAYYVPSANQFVMPIGILQYPFFDPKLPDHVNLGAVGSVIGHELGHGIDDKGAKYDDNGKLNQWMSDKDLEQFQAKGSKLIAQFNQVGHNGQLTLGENIGDLVGLSFAYAAAFPGDKGKLKDKQEFFLQYARLYCQVIRPKLEERLLKTDPHALGPARVNEQVKHQPGFQTAFQCKSDDPMTLKPTDRVVIW